MKYRLLDKTLRVYVLISILVALIMAPTFYFLTERLLDHEADEELFLRKLEFVKYNQPTLRVLDIPVWNSMSRDVKVEENNRVARDSLFNVLSIGRLDKEEVPYRVLLTPIRIEGIPKTLMVRSNLIEAGAIVKNIAILFCLILLLLLAGLYFITRILSTRLWKPFYATIAQLEEFELDKNARPKLATTDIEEFERLNTSVDKLLEKNLMVFKSQKEFIENAAHELQTPIALFLAKLDVLVQEVHINQGMGDALSSLHESAARMIRLNKNLLLLSKIENDQYAFQENVFFHKVLAKQSEFLKEQLDEKNIQLTIDIFESVERIANLTLVEVAIGNLLLNALRHNLPNGIIAVNLTADSIIIMNSGNEPISFSDTHFSRFSKTGSNGGSGLGLAIVKKICDQHGWTLSYTFGEKMHIFRISFVS